MRNVKKIILVLALVMSLVTPSAFAMNRNENTMAQMAPYASEWISGLWQTPSGEEFTLNSHDYQWVYIFYVEQDSNNIVSAQVRFTDTNTECSVLIYRGTDKRIYMKLSNYKGVIEDGIVKLEG